LQALEREINQTGRSAVGCATDVTDRASVDRLTTLARERFGTIDILVNNAGVMPLSPLRQMRVEDWDQMIDVNLRGLLYCIASTLPVMLEQGGGHIVNVCSVAGRRPFPSGVVYAATKAAVRTISDGIRLELSPHDRIRVTDIEPGVVRTELMGHISDPTTKERFDTTWSEKRPLAPEDVARTILFAVSQPAHVNVNEILLRPTDQET
jgi:NADP-dependent 3-hydroxy acid dehydrogenase YdfG